MNRVLIAILMSLASAASAQEVTDAEADPLAGTRAFLCHLGGTTLIVPLQTTADGSTEAQGDFTGWQVTEAGGRISLVAGDTFVQIDGGNSLAVTDGDLMQGDCLDVSSEIEQLIAIALGGDTGQMIVSLRDTWVGRAQAAEEEVRSLQADLARQGQPSSCATQAGQIVPWIAEAMPRLENPDTPDAERSNVGRMMRTRLATLQRLCGGE